FTEDEYGFEFDRKLLEAAEFRLMMLVTRLGGAHLGGAFDVLDVAEGAGGDGYSCSEEFPEYVSLDATNYVFEPDGGFDDWKIIGKYDLGELSFSGRLIDGRAYNGDSITTPGGAEGYTDYSVTYGSLPADAYKFNSATDRTSLDGSNFCNSAIDDQPVLSFQRVGSVSPYPDRVALEHLTQAGPMRYRLTYQARENPEDATPDTALSPVTLDITIHADGAVFTDNSPADGNPGYTGSSVPDGEFEIGMVSSVFRAPLVSPADVEQAVLNL